MKKFFVLLTLSMIVLICAVGLSYAEENPELLSVRFTLPQGHYYISVDSNNHFHYDDVVTVQFERGHVLTEEDVKPFECHCSSQYAPHDFCKVSFLGWDKDPVGVVVDEYNMAFNAILNEDVCEVTVKAEPGHFYSNGRNYETYKFYVDKGYTITESDIEEHLKVMDYQYQNYPNYSNNPYKFNGFDKAPLGMVINEDTEITVLTKKLITVYYYLPTLNTEEYPSGYRIALQKHGYVYEGEALARENLYEVNPDELGMVDFYWNVTDTELAAIYSNDDITGGFDVYGAGTFRGDCNQDMQINTADAVTILRSIADMHDFSDIQKKAADANNDGTINTSDAVIVLQYAAGIKALP